MTCADPWWTMLRSGAKTVEGRRNAGRWKRIVAGDTIEFVRPGGLGGTGGDRFLATVANVTVYSGQGALQTYLETETLLKTLPGVTTVEQGTRVYTGFYTGPAISHNDVLKEIDASGFLAISVKPRCTESQSVPLQSSPSPSPSSPSPSSSSAPSLPPPAPTLSVRLSSAVPTLAPRGRFIVFEGMDRCSKTTQAGRLVEWLTTTGRLEPLHVRFPDRTTRIGHLIDAEIKSKAPAESTAPGADPKTSALHHLDDVRALHLLFSANRWERAAAIRDALASGRDVVADRVLRRPRPRPRVVRGL